MKKSIWALYFVTVLLGLYFLTLFAPLLNKEFDKKKADDTLKFDIHLTALTGTGLPHKGCPANFLHCVEQNIELDLMSLKTFTLKSSCEMKSRLSEDDCLRQNSDDCLCQDSEDCLRQNSDDNCLVIQELPMIEINDKSNLRFNTTCEFTFKDSIRKHLNTKAKCLRLVLMFLMAQQVLFTMFTSQDWLKLSSLSGLVCSLKSNINYRCSLKGQSTNNHLNMIFEWSKKHHFHCKPYFNNTTNQTVFPAFNMSRLASYARTAKRDDISFLRLSQAGFRYTGPGNSITCDECLKLNNNSLEKNPNSADLHNPGCKYIIPDADSSGEVSESQNNTNFLPVISGQGVSFDLPESENERGRLSEADAELSSSLLYNLPDYHLAKTSHNLTDTGSILLDIAASSFRPTSLGPGGYIPLDQLTLNNLPSNVRNEDFLHLINLCSELTVQIECIREHVFGAGQHVLGTGHILNIHSELIPNKNFNLSSLHNEHKLGIVFIETTKHLFNNVKEPQNAVVTLNIRHPNLAELKMEGKYILHNKKQDINQAILVCQTTNPDIIDIINGYQYEVQSIATQLPENIKRSVSQLAFIVSFMPGQEKVLSFGKSKHVSPLSDVSALGEDNLRKALHYTAATHPGSSGAPVITFKKEKDAAEWILDIWTHCGRKLKHCHTPCPYMGVSELKDVKKKVRSIEGSSLAATLKVSTFPNVYDNGQSAVTGYSRDVSAVTGYSRDVSAVTGYSSDVNTENIDMAHLRSNVISRAGTHLSNSLDPPPSHDSDMLIESAQSIVSNQTDESDETEHQTIEEDFSDLQNRIESFNQWTTVHYLDPVALSEQFYYFIGPAYSIKCWNCKCVLLIKRGDTNLKECEQELREGRPIGCLCYHNLKSLES